MSESKMFVVLLKLTMAIFVVALVVIGSGCAATPEADVAVSFYDKVPGGAYAVVAEIRAKPGKENKLRAATLPLVADVRHEPNNLFYFLHEDREAPGH
jgi:hypothetical protein